MILSHQSIFRRVMSTLYDASVQDLLIDPFQMRGVIHGMSYGLSAAGYDVRIKDTMFLAPGDFALGVTVERIALPTDLMAELKDKSTWARRGIAVQNTVFEPGWRGYPTVELSNHGPHIVRVPAGAPIGQLIFHVLDAPTCAPYAGKYQDQPQRPIEAIEEKEIA